MARTSGSQDSNTTTTGADRAACRPDAVTIARLEGQLETLRAQLAALEAADEHHRAELAGARAEAAEAQAMAREWQIRLEDTVEELRRRLAAAEAAQTQAEHERAAVIAGMSWRARRRLSRPS